MRSRGFGVFLTLIVTVLFSSCGQATRPAGLKIGYGLNGIERLSLNGVVLEDLAAHPTDAFHIWHMKASTVTGKPVPGRECEWGEVNNGRRWEAATHTWLYSFVWGTISVQFVQKAETLEMHVVEKNNTDSGIIFKGATIYPFVLRFPELPKGFGDASYEHLAVKAGDPVPVADFGPGQVSVTADAGSQALYRGFEPAGNSGGFVPVISRTAMDSMSTAYPRLDRPVTPGASDEFTVSLRFASTDPDSE